MATSLNNTPFDERCSILATLWNEHRDNKGLQDFIEYNDLGLPLAYFASEGLAEVSEDGQKYILETWELFLASLGLEDKGFETLEQVFDASPHK